MPTIRSMRREDWDAVKRIYEEGVATGDATFQTSAPSWTAWDAGHRPDCRLIAEWKDEIVGWAMLSAISSREVYRGVAEVSIYVGASARGCGVGRMLIASLIAASEAAGVWTLQAGIFPENTASLALHERAGFRGVGLREKLGKHRERWRDVVLLERRSRVAGTE